MKFNLPTHEFNQLIGKIQNIAVTQKPSLPILANFLVEAYNDELTLTATDLSISIRCQADAQITEEGSITLPAKTLAQLARELTAPTVQFSTVNNICSIVSGTSRFKIPGMSKSEYPELPDLANANCIQIKQADLKDLIFRTSFAIAKDDDRYALMGALMEIEKGTIILVGTDGKRLARAHQTIEIDPEFSARMIIPSKAVEEIHKNLADEGLAKLYLMDDKIAVEVNKTLIIAKLLSGEYPDFSRIIPETSETILNLHCEELASLLRQISLFRSENSHSVRFIFAEGEMKLTSNTSNVGEGHVSMPVNYLGPKIEVAFHPGYFLDILRHCKKETIAMGLTDPYNPSVLTDADSIGKSLEASPLYVLMPMRLAET